MQTVRRPYSFGRRASIGARYVSTIRLLRRPAVYDRYPLGHTQLNENIKRGLFVTPVRISGRAVAFPAHEVDAICAARVAGRNDDEIRSLVAKLQAARGEAE